MMRCTKVGAISLLMFVFLAVSAGATVYYVDCTKSDNSGNGQSWANAKKTVQAAIDAASSGDEVWVKACTGGYNEHIDMKAGVSLYGGFAGSETLRDQRSPATNETILDATGLTNSVVTAGTGVTTATVIDGFTIQNGTGRVSGSNRYGGGVSCNGGSPTISHNKITNNTATHGGGVFAPSGDSPVIEYNTIQGNQATSVGSGVSMINGTCRYNTITLNTNSAYGGGVYVGSYATQATISDNTISQNGSSAGAGVFCSDSSATISGNTISTNTATGAGGGISCSGGSVTIENNDSISGNSAASAGGINCSQGTPTISGNTIDDNDATNYGGICAYESTATITGNTISNNTATSGVGGILCAYGGSSTISGNTITGNTASGADSGGLHCYSNSATISNNSFQSNHAASAGGGMTSYNQSGVISNNTFASNSAAYGGAMRHYYSSPTVINNRITGNSATGWGGGVFWWGDKSGVQGKLINNTIADNTNANAGGLRLYDTSLVVANNIIAYNSSGIVKDGTGSPTITYNDVYNPSGSNYNWSPAPSTDVQSDPLFVNRTGSNYHLTLDSPCVDTGDDNQVSTGWLDMDGEPRQVDIPDKGTQGTKVDIGADEYYPDYTNSAVIDRDLPASGLNNDAGVNRCNIRWADTSTSAGYGDDFKLLEGPAWKIDEVVVWTVPDVPMYPAYHLGDVYSDVALYLGTSTVSSAQSGDFTAGYDNTDNPNIIVESVRYESTPNATDYQCADGTYNQIWRIRFTNLNWTAPANAEHIYFGALGSPRIDRLWLNHATAATNGTIFKFTTSGEVSSADGSAWFGDKDTDINVRVYAHPVLP